ncbi:MAG TPA: DNA polymerase III subunit beta [Polyangiaceae bacterium]|jgi:DNA polymerase-3 subunit beta|nr:MAG: DNA polymerase III subunit beta [Deltaproteobacteria bacterium ADurb.Bin207]HNS95713.1 DNA polymerase III subunit beta [Polyangiaceae bacterium]HNZ21180.1 DNA polymerase III subunit beta [Polyangiaceae bacterium]HOD23682.1 DNA polymerase III subunit beta [Polyangiaceae bacterium]HOE48074.1 DNA polymerase III subunit beta [Polyangiaceae bacterium]
MNITVPKKDLLRLVARCQGVVDKKSTMPVLANVLISVDSPKAIRIAATDLYLSISGHTEAEVDQGGSAAVPARDLFERIKAMPDGPISISVGAGGTEVQSKTSARRYRLHGLSGDSFPSLPEPAPDAPTLELEVDVLSRLIGQTQFSISTDETRAHLNSALFEWEGDRIRMVTTDGHRLTKVEATVPGRHATATMLIPYKAITELRKLTDEFKGLDAKSESPTMVTITQFGPNAFFSIGDTRFSVKLVDAQFPAYQQVIPKSSERVVRAPRAILMDALRAVSLAASDRTGGVQLSIESGTMRILSESPESGDGSDELPVEYTGTAMKIGFNAKYLLDVLAVLDDEEVDLLLSGELDPAIIKPTGESDGRSFVGVVMPMRI